MTVLESYRSLAQAQKGRARGAPAYSLYVNRPLGRILASVAHAAGLTPNQVTLLSALFTFTGIVLVMAVPPSLPLGIAVWLLLAIGYAWDSADGQVARLRGGGSLVGEWLDHIVDSAKLVSLHIAVAIGAFRFFDPLEITWLLVPLAFTVVATVTFFGMILNDLLRARIGAPQAAQAGGSSPLRAVLGIPTDYGTWCFMFVLWGWATGFMIVYLLLAVAAVLYLAAALIIWFRKMKALDIA
ncbi:CDP-alcohol phosphatidyltransferase [Brachybacterium avium]|uniref:CDP-alcohol phosphatidyltransferase n=1 Tax=Brachybacterium avium TaxID=2017485 RepID=A0A220UDN7_9MICO|nr:CDP-alcohol phosphatidyltransferase family protein [Brachybacterium avium]ASK66022.1 CDP-alcohol phosphatidyltransferase [Brachybacterium avium]